MKKNLTPIIMMLGFLSSIFAATINVGTGSGNDFATLQEAVTSLNHILTEDTQISLNGEFFDERVEVFDFNTTEYELTFVGIDNSQGKPVLTNSAANNDFNHSLHIKNSSNIRIENIKFTSGNENFGNCVEIEDACNDIYIIENRFEGMWDTGSSPFHKLLNIFKGNDFSMSNITILHNTFVNGTNQVNIATSGYINIENINVVDNIFQNGTQAIYIEGATSPEVTSNDMYGGTKRGIYLRNCDGAPDISMSSLRVIQTGIYLEFCNLSNGSSFIYNNEIIVEGDGTADDQAKSLVLANTNNAKVVYNNIVNHSAKNRDGDFPNPRNITLVVDGEYNQIYSNNIIHSGKGVALSVKHFEADDPKMNAFNGNNIYSNGYRLVTFGQTADRQYQSLSTFLSEYTNDENNISFPLYYYDENDIYQTMFYSPFGDNRGSAIDFGITEDILGVDRGEHGSDIGCYAYSIDEPAPTMEGDYTIGVGSDFETINEAVKTLTKRGLSEDVTFLLTDSEYDEKIEIFLFPQYDLYYQKNVTFKPASSSAVTFKFTPESEEEDFLMKLHRNRNLKFENINFVDESSTFLQLVVLDAYNEDITFNNCNFTAPESSDEILFHGPHYTNTQNLTVNNCTFTNANIGIKLYESGMYVYDRNTRILNSTFTNQHNSLHLSGCKELYIENNLIENFTYSAIMMNGNEWFEIRKNRILSENATYFALDLANSSGFQHEDTGYNCNIVSNNIIKTSSNGLRFTGNSINGACIDVAHNTISVSGNNNKAVDCFMENLVLRNNILSSETDYALRLYGLSENFSILGNHYYGGGSKFILVTDFMEFRDMQEFRDSTSFCPDELEGYEVNVYPFFTEGMHSRSAEIHPSWIYQRITHDIDGNERDGFLHATCGAYEDETSIVHTSQVITVGGVDDDFDNIQECLNWVSRAGVKRDSTFIKIEAGTYEEELIFYTIPSDTLNRVVKIMPKNEDAVVNIAFPDSSNISASLLTLLGTDNLTIENINFVNEDKTYAKLIELKAITDDLNINECEFNVNEEFSSSSAIVGLGVYSRDMTFYKNIFENGEFAIKLTPANYKTIYGTKIWHNEFNGTLYPINISHGISSYILMNNMYNFKNAISISYGTASILLNRMISSGSAGSYSSATAVALHSCSGRFETNIIKLSGHIQALTGLYVYYTDDMSIYQNTILVEQSYSAGWGQPVSIQSEDQHIRMKNNVLALDGFGYAFRANFSSNGDPFESISNNCFSANGPYFASINNIEYRTFNEFKNATEYTINSIEAYPFLDEDGFTTSPYLRDKGINEVGMMLNTMHKPDDIVHLWHWDDDPEIPRDIGANFVCYSYEDYAPFTENVNSADYSTLDSALIDIEKRGINSNVSLIIPEGNYEGQIKLRTIPNTSGTRNFTLKGESSNSKPVFSFNSPTQDNNHILDIGGMHNLRIEDLKFKAVNETYKNAITWKGNIDSVSISNCQFESTPSSNSSYQESPAIRSEFSYNSLNIYGNYFYGYPGAISLTKFWFDDYQYSDLTIANNTIVDCYYGLFLKNGKNTNITANTISNIERTGITMQDCQTPFSIRKNNISVKTYHGMEIFNLVNEEELEPKIDNNFVTVDGTNSDKKAVYITNASNLAINYNTFRIYDSNSTDEVFEMNGDCHNLDLNNNILYLDGEGYAFRSNNTTDIADMDNNIFHSTGTYSIQWGSMNIGTQEDLNTTGMTNSLIADPLFDENGMLEDSSPAYGAASPFENILTDIDNNPRSATTPTVGAYEMDNGVPVVTPPTALEFPNVQNLLIDFAEYISGNTENIKIFAAGNENVKVGIDNLVVTLSVNEGWTGTEIISFTVKDDYNSEKSLKTKKSRDDKGTIFTFDIEITVIAENV